MGLKRSEWTKEFKLQVITEVEAGQPMSPVAREHQVTATPLRKWRKQHRQYTDKALAGNGRAYTDEARTAELERRVGRLTMECDLLKKALHKLGASACHGAALHTTTRTLYADAQRRGSLLVRRRRGGSENFDQVISLKTFITTSGFIQLSATG